MKPGTTLKRFCLRGSSGLVTSLAAAVAAALLAGSASAGAYWVELHGNVGLCSDPSACFSSGQLFTNTVSSGPLTYGTSVAGPPSGSGSSQMNATTSLGSFGVAATAYSEGDGGGAFNVGEQFADVLYNVTPGTYTLWLWTRGDTLQTSGDYETQATVTTQTVFSLSGPDGSVSLDEEVCSEEYKGASISCGTGWQDAPSTKSINFTVTQTGTYELSGYMAVTGVANGGYLQYLCAGVCFDYYSATATLNYPDPEVYVEALNGGTYTSASGHSYNLPASVPEPATLTLLGLGLAGLSFSRRRKSN